MGQSQGLKSLNNFAVRFFIVVAIFSFGILLLNINSANAQTSCQKIFKVRKGAELTNLIQNIKPLYSRENLLARKELLQPGKSHIVLHEDGNDRTVIEYRKVKGVEDLYIVKYFKVSIEDQNEQIASLHESEGVVSSAGIGRLLDVITPVEIIKNAVVFPFFEGVPALHFLESRAHARGYPWKKASVKEQRLENEWDDLFEHDFAESYFIPDAKTDLVALQVWTALARVNAALMNSAAKLGLVTNSAGGIVSLLELPDGTKFPSCAFMRGGAKSIFSRLVIGLDYWITSDGRLVQIGNY